MSNQNNPHVPIRIAIKQLLLFTFIPTDWFARLTYLVLILSAIFYGVIGQNILAWSMVMVIFGVVWGRVSAISDSRLRLDED